MRKLMTMQSAFSKAYRGLARQGFRRSVGYDDQCLYRGLNGLKCAIGFLLTDDEANICEAKDVPALSYLGQLPASLNNINTIFLTELQQSHDIAARSPYRMKSNLKALAKRFNLKVPSVRLSKKASP